MWYISRFIEARAILFAALQHRRPGTAQGLVPFTGWRFFKKTKTMKIKYYTKQQHAVLKYCVEIDGDCVDVLNKVSLPKKETVVRAVVDFLHSRNILEYPPIVFEQLDSARSGIRTIFSD